MMNGNNPNSIIMRNNIVLVIVLIVFFAGISACHSPEEASNTEKRYGINSITASFPYEYSTENNFPGEIDYANQIITIVFPYNYPKLSDNILPYECLKKVKLSAKVDNNIIISPSMGYFDLTKDCYITVKDQTAKTSQKYKIIAEIRKNDACTIDRFSIPSKGLTGVIDEKNHIISIISIADIGEQVAEITLAHGATCTPDLQNMALNYDQEQTVKVVAQNGKDFLTYTIKKNVPDKIAAGIRANSGKLLWAKKLSEIGITSKNKVTSLGILDDYVIINERGNGEAIYLNNQSGEVVGKMDISTTVTGDFGNYYMTSDNANNILICNYTPNGTTMFTVWKTNGINGQFQKYIDYKAVTAGTERFGWSISIQGNLDKDALITTPVFYKDDKIQFARWQVVNGVLQSQIPTFIEMKSLVYSTWFKQADIIYTDPSNTESDYFLASYAKYDVDQKRYFLWFNGADNTIKAKKEVPSSINGPVTAVDYIEFNNTPYVAHTIVNGFSWAVTGSDIAYMYDLSTQSLTTPIEICETKIYGGIANDGQNTEGASDVVLRASKDGYYLYAYFMFANGYVACKQYDCIDQ